MTRLASWCSTTSGRRSTGRWRCPPTTSCTPSSSGMTAHGPLWWGNDVDGGRTKAPATRLARLLKPFDIKPKQLWIEGGKVRGYTAEMFEKAWETYLPPLPPQIDGRTVDGRENRAPDQASTVLPSPGGGKASTVFDDGSGGSDGCPECGSLWVFGHADDCPRRSA
jgi:Protein of unknown function (DUF3631)